MTSERLAGAGNLDGAVELAVDPCFGRHDDDLAAGAAAGGETGFDEPDITGEAAIHFEGTVGRHGLFGDLIHGLLLGLREDAVGFAGEGDGEVLAVFHGAADGVGEVEGAIGGGFEIGAVPEFLEEFEFFPVGAAADVAQRRGGADHEGGGCGDSVSRPMGMRRTSLRESRSLDCCLKSTETRVVAP